MMKNIKQWLWVQKEGLVIGCAWGLISVYAALGIANQTSLSLFHIFLILPTYLGNLLVGDVNAGIFVFLVPIMIGGAIGILLDMVYKPKE